MCKLLKILNVIVLLIVLVITILIRLEQEEIKTRIGNLEEIEIIVEPYE